MPVKIEFIAKGGKRKGVKFTDTFTAKSKNGDLKIDAQSVPLKWEFGGTLKDDNAEVVKRHVEATKDVMKKSWSNFKTACEKSIASELTTLESKIAKSNSGASNIDAEKTAQDIATRLLQSEFEAFSKKCSNTVISSLGTKGAKAKALTWTCTKTAFKVGVSGAGLTAGGVGTVAAIGAVGTAGLAPAIMAVIALIGGIIGAIVMLKNSYKDAINEYKLRQDKYEKSAKLLVAALEDTYKEAQMMRQKWDKLLLTRDKLQKEFTKLETQFKNLDSAAKKLKALKEIDNLKAEWKKYDDKIDSLKDYDPEAVEKYTKKLKDEISGKLQLDAAAAKKEAFVNAVGVISNINSMASNIAKLNG